MRVLIAEDEPRSRRLLAATLERAGHEVLATENGQEALDVLGGADAPRLAVLDWMMPQLDGPAVCRALREQPERPYVYLVILTALGDREHVVSGLGAGADDYLTKPFDPQELCCRVATGERILALQSALEAKVEELESALSHVKQLQGLLPICMHCKKIRTDDQSWQRIETYIQEHSEARFTHSVCGECIEKHHTRR
jgi:DNA-binding response OmpR family regulator